MLTNITNKLWGVKLFIKNKIKYKRQIPYKIAINNEIIGKYYLDYLIENKIILELKKGNYFSKKNIEQVKGYLKVTNLKLAILATFSTKGIRYFRILNPNNIKT